MLQKVQWRVQTSPMSRKVAVRLPKHSPRLGQLALSQTVCRAAVRSRRLTSLYSVPPWRFMRSQEGLRGGRAARPRSGIRLSWSMVAVAF